MLAAFDIAALAVVIAALVTLVGLQKPEYFSWAVVGDRSVANLFKLPAAWLQSFAIIALVLGLAFLTHIVVGIVAIIVVFAGFSVPEFFNWAGKYNPFVGDNWKDFSVPFAVQAPAFVAAAAFIGAEIHPIAVIVFGAFLAWIARDEARYKKYIGSIATVQRLWLIIVGAGIALTGLAWTIHSFRAEIFALVVAVILALSMFRNEIAAAVKARINGDTPKPV